LASIILKEVSAVQYCIVLCQPYPITALSFYTSRATSISTRFGAGAILAVSWRRQPLFSSDRYCHPSSSPIRPHSISPDLSFSLSLSLPHTLSPLSSSFDLIPLFLPSGLIEAIPDTVSLDVLRKKDVQYSSLLDFFERFFGIDGSPRFVRARHNFIRSLAGYCVVCYILNLKDRHNGNILLDVKGHIMHIDYGFILGNARSSLLHCLTHFLTRLNSID
jgi:hypothetical protein